MQHFFEQLDHIYCLCIQSRKAFVIEQFTKLGIMEKSTIFDAYTDQSPKLYEVIKDHLVRPIIINEPKNFANFLGSMEIMEDVINKKYNYAMIIEDDVLFLENMFTVANKYISKYSIGNNFDVNKPYILYLLAKKIFAEMKTGINKNNKFMFGQPAFILNYKACETYVKKKYPIVNPIDNYKHQIEKDYNIQTGLLYPYIVAELSANYGNYDTSNINYKFTRDIHMKPIKGVDSYIFDSTFYIRTKSITFEKLARRINNKLKLCINQKSKRLNMMYYDVDNYVSELGNNYVLGGTIDPNVKILNTRYDIMTVRGSLSANTVKKITGENPIIHDFASLIPLYFPIKLMDPKISYCFVFKNNPNINNPDSKWISPENKSIPELFNSILEAKYVVSDIPDIVSATNAYGRKVAYGTIDTPSKQEKYVFNDLFNKTIEPIVVKNNNELLFEQINSYPTLNIVRYNFNLNKYIVAALPFTNYVPMIKLIKKRTIKKRTIKKRTIKKRNMLKIEKVK